MLSGRYSRLITLNTIATLNVFSRFEEIERSVFKFNLNKKYYCVKQRNINIKNVKQKVNIFGRPIFCKRDKINTVLSFGF